MSLLEMQGIGKAYKMGKVESVVLQDIDLKVEEGDYLSICGPSGSGKSSLLSILGLLSTPSTGEYLFGHKNIGAFKSKQLAELRNRYFGFIFQAFNLSSEMNVEENIGLPLSYRKDLSRKDCRFAVANILEKMYLDKFKNYFPHQLSGGQQQRVAIARALAGKPKVILADEPTGNLDSKNAATVMEIFNRMNYEGTTICLVTHDPRSADYADRKIQLFDGKILPNATRRSFDRPFVNNESDMRNEYILQNQLAHKL